MCPFVRDKTKQGTFSRCRSPTGREERMPCGCVFGSKGAAYGGPGRWPIRSLALLRVREEDVASHPAPTTNTW